MNRSGIVALCIAAFCLSAAAQWNGGSKVVNDTIQSKVLNAGREYTVLLPESYDREPDRKYPVLYLLHGMWDDNRCWVNKARLKDVMDRLVRSGQADEMIVVTPDAGGNAEVEQNGYFNMPGWNYEDFFFNEFMPTVENKYRVIGGRRHRAISGLSMGGGGSISYAQRHPELFGSVYAMSALTDLPSDRDIEHKNALIAKLYRSVSNLSCIKYVNTADEVVREQLRGIAWYVDCGDDDFLLDRNIEFYQSMRNAGIPCQLRVRDGAHDWEYWHSALYESIPFATRYFNK